jgi:hypothetical protein
MKIVLGAIALVTIGNSIASTTTVFAWSPEDRRISNRPPTPALMRYCVKLRKEMIASDPGHYVIGKIENADPIDGEPASNHYYWINELNENGVLYFDGHSTIGRKILNICKVGQLCAVKVGVEKSWEHNVDHATFWISKIVGEPIGQ